MTERDAFEARFHAAVRGYAGRVSSDLDAVELAARIAAAGPPRRARTLTLRWPAFAAPRVAWTLLLLGGLLAALVGGLLVAGSLQRPRFPAVVPPIAPAFECPPGSSPDAPGPLDQARPPDGFDGMVFDRDAGKLVVTSNRETWTFDVCTNTWARRQAAPFEPGARLVFDADSGLTIAIEGVGTVWAYDLGANSWTKRGAAPWPLVPWVRLAYDPGSGLVLVALPTDPPALWTYDVGANAWQGIPIVDGAEPLGQWSERFMAYDASVGRMVAYVADDGDRMATDRTILLDPGTGAWSRAAAVTPDVYRNFYEPDGEIAYDEATQRTVVFGVSGQDDRVLVIAYDAEADAWTTLYSAAWTPGTPGSGPATGPAPRSQHWMAYDPVNRRLVVAGGRRTGGAGVADDVLAFDTTTRRWTQLLAPSTP